jgi:subtilase family serine protease
LHAALYAVDHNVAPVMSMSANNGCEAANTPANITFYQGIALEANAQGMTWVVSGGDAGPAACDANGAAIATSGLSVRFPASIPEVTAVGGTEFDEGTGNYWSSTNTPNGASALSYIPEMVWNDDVALSLLWAGGGGSSILFPKPAWQAGPGVPSDNARHMPDLAMAASFYHDGYYIVKNGAASITGGTSASAPVFAGVLVLLNHYLVTNKIISTPGLGNVNPTLYQLANATRTVFHDITVGNNIVICVTGTPNCPSGTMGFSAAPGYDLTSGLGSVNVAQLLQCHPRGHEKDAAFTCLHHRSK